MNLKIIYDKILTLSFVVFEQIFEEVSSSLENKKYTKSLRYQQRVYLKEKWSTCYSPQLFTAGI